jgi:hypothetical protein
MVHGKAWHSESQGFIENRNKVALTFLTKWCLQNNTALLASLSREEDLNRALEIPQEQMLEFYNQDKSKTANIPIFIDEGVEEFHLFEFEGSSLDLVEGDLEQFILNGDDGGGKPPAKQAAVCLTNEEQATNRELTDILMEECGDDKEKSKVVEADRKQSQEVEAEVEKDEDDVSTEVEAEEVEGETSSALLSPNRKDKRDLAHGNIDSHAQKS